MDTCIHVYDTNPIYDTNLKREGIHVIPWRGATWGNTSIGHEAEGKRGAMGKRLYCGFFEKEQVR